MALDEEFLNGIPADEAGEGAFDDETLFKEYRCVADKDDKYPAQAIIYGTARSLK